MLDDDVRIRPAGPGEAEDLTDVAWRSKSYWDYPPEIMKEFCDSLDITAEFIENNPTYIIENEETGELIGFYCLEPKDGGWWLKHLWVVPEHIGTGMGGELFLHACEMAETSGADCLYIISDPNSEEFYLHMGAEKIGEEPRRDGRPTFRIRLR